MIVEFVARKEFDTRATTQSGMGRGKCGVEVCLAFEQGKYLQWLYIVHRSLKF